MPPPPPLPPELIRIAFWLTAFLLLATLARRASRRDEDAMAREVELDRYRALVSRAGGHLQAGRLTDAKLVIDEELWDLRARARRGERSRHIPAEVRREVWERDGGRCVRCGVDEDLQYDHIVPWSRGGAHSVENLELLCGRCNREKSDRIG